MAQTSEQSLFSEDATPDEELSYLLGDGSDLLHAGRIHEAKERFESALEIHPEHEQAKNLLALSFFRLGELEPAQRIFEELLHENPVEPSLRLNLAMVHLKASRLEEARHELERALDLSPEHRRAAGYMGLVCERLERFDEAAGWYAQAGNEEQAAAMRQRAQEVPEAPEVPEPPLLSAEGEAVDELMPDPKAPTLPVAEGEVQAATLSALRRDVVARPPATPSPAEAENAREASYDYTLEVDEVPEPPPFEELSLMDGAPIDDDDDDVDVDVDGVDVDVGVDVEGPPEVAPPPTASFAPPAMARAVPLAASQLEVRPLDVSEIQTREPRPPVELEQDQQGQAELEPAEAEPAEVEPEEAEPDELDLTELEPEEPRDGAPPYAAQPPPPLEVHPDEVELMELEPEPPEPTMPYKGIPEAPPGRTPLRAPEPAPAAALSELEPAPLPRPVAASHEGPPAGSAPPMPATRVAEAATLASLVRPDQASPVPTVSRGADGLVIFPITEAGYVRADLLVSLEGTFEVEPVYRRYRGRRTDSFFGGSSSPLAAALGEGAAWLDPGAREVTVLELKEEELYLAEASLLAFGAGLVWENGRLPEEGGRDLDIVHLRGAGLIALVSARPVFALEVRGQPMTVAAERLVGWSGTLVPSRGPLPGLPETVKRPSVVRFEGSGRVLVI